MRIVGDLVFMGVECGKTRLLCRDQITPCLSYAGDCTLAIVSFLCAEDGWGLASSLVFRRGAPKPARERVRSSEVQCASPDLCRVLLPAFDNSSQCWLHHLKLATDFLDLRSLLFKPSGHRFQLAL